MTVLGSLTALALLACSSSCNSTTELDQQAARGGTQGDPQVPRPWTARFRSPALLVADRAYIEGPKGLLDHLACRSEDGFHSYEAETLPEGFKQSFRVLNQAAGVELRAYLDGFSIVAFHELIVLERPGELPVRVVLSGDAYMRDGTTGKERRGSQLEIVGALDGPPEPEEASSEVGAPNEG